MKDNYIKTLEESIKTVEERLNSSSEKDLIKKRRRKKIGKLINFFIPLIVSAVIVTLSILPIGWDSFFKRGETKKHPNIMTTIDSSHNIEIQQQEKSFAEKNTIISDSGWYKNDELEIFERVVDTYTIDNDFIADEDVEFYLEEKILDSLRHTNRSITQKDVLSEEDEKNMEPKTTLIYLSKDESEYTLVKENFFLFVGRYALYYAIIGSMWLTINKIRKFKIAGEFDNINKVFEKEMAEFQDMDYQKLVLAVRKKNMERISL